MNHGNFILAAGEQARWTPPEQLKHLLDIGGEKLIERTIRQINHRSNIPYLVTHREVYQNYSSKIINPEGRRWTSETLFSTRKFWPSFDRINIFLGDVVYSSDLMQQVFNSREPVQFFHTLQRPGNDELLAITFATEQSPLILKALDDCLDKAQRKKHGGKLWYLYRAINNLTYYKHCVLDHSMAKEIIDYSIDFDIPQHYQDFLAKYPKLPVES